MYAPTDAGNRVVDALSAALIAKSTRLANVLRIENVGRDVETLQFHTSSWHGAPTRSSDHWWPDLGELVEVHLNDDNKLVAVWYAPKGST